MGRTKIFAPVFFSKRSGDGYCFFYFFGECHSIIMIRGVKKMGSGMNYPILDNFFTSVSIWLINLFNLSFSVKAGTAFCKSCFEDERMPLRSMRFFVFSAWDYTSFPPWKGFCLFL